MVSINFIENSQCSSLLKERVYPRVIENERTKRESNMAQNLQVVKIAKKKHVIPLPTSFPSLKLRFGKNFTTFSKHLEKVIENT